jgi:hypothetical protein
METKLIPLDRAYRLAVTASIPEKIKREIIMEVIRGEK